MRSPSPSPLLLAAMAILLAVGLIRAGEIRERAAAALGRGVPAREAALARGFVLGEDEGVDAATAEDFRRSGLSHLLRYLESGQNVESLGLSETQAPSQLVDATYTTASEAELRRRVVEGDRNAKAELVRRSKQASEPLSPEAEELVEKLRVEFDAVEVAA